MKPVQALVGMDPIVMRRRQLIAAALGIPFSAALPGWAAQAADTPDLDNILAYGSWGDTYHAIEAELTTLADKYRTEDGALERHAITNSSLWLYSQAVALTGSAPAGRTDSARRLSAQVAMFAGGCYIDQGNNPAATDLYSKAHIAAGPDNGDLRAFIATQSNWVGFSLNRWDSVLNRARSATSYSDRVGGYALLQGPMHMAHVHALRGQRQQAFEALDLAHANVHRVPDATLPHSPLRYSASKVYFSSSLIYAQLGDSDRYEQMLGMAMEDPHLGWVDHQLLMMGQARLDPDPENAAGIINQRFAAIPQGTFSGYVKAEADRVLRRLRSRPGGGTEVDRLGEFLRTVPIS